MFRPDYPIETERLCLRPFRPDDLDALHAIQARPEVVRYLYHDIRPIEGVREMLETRLRQDAIRAEGDKLKLALELRETGAVIGDVHLDWLSEAHKQGEIGFVLHADHHGKGLAHEAALVMLRLGFEEFGLHRIIGRCDARNRASARALARLGMRLEAHILENEFVKGEWTDEFLYAMLAREWSALTGRR